MDEDYDTVYEEVINMYQDDNRLMMRKMEEKRIRLRVILIMIVRSRLMMQAVVMVVWIRVMTKQMKK